MRWQVWLLVLIVAIVVAMALLRPAYRDSGRAPRTAAPTSLPIESTNYVDDTPTTEIEIDTSKSLPVRDIPLPLPQPQLPPVKPGSVDWMKTRTLQVDVVDIEGNPVENAHVLVMSSTDYQMTYKASHLRTNKEGRAEFEVLVEREWVLLYASKPGLGFSANHFSVKYRPDVPVLLKLIPAALLRIVCTTKDGAPLKDVEVEVRAEYELGKRYDLYGNYLGSKYVRIPTPKALTNSEGRCDFEFLDRGWVKGKDGLRVQAWNFTITATGPGGPIEQKIEGIPEKEVVIVLE